MERAVHPCFEEAVRATGGAELTTHDVGLAILGPLQELDLVAYLRFASVYRAFDSLEDFEAAIAELRERWPPVRRCTGTCLSWPQVGIPSSLAQRQRCPLLAPGGGVRTSPRGKVMRFTNCRCVGAEIAGGVMSKELKGSQGHWNPRRGSSHVCPCIATTA